MSAPETRFSYAAPHASTRQEISHVDAENLRRAGVDAPLKKRFAAMLADQLQLAPDSLLRSDMSTPMEYDDIVPKLQAEMEAQIKDFSAAAEQICTAIREGKTIGISADYDADGNTSLALFIRLLRECGVPREKIITHIPNREEDGYGVNEAAVDDLVAKHVDVMITLDNGTRAEKPIKKALAAGMEVVVIDHHGDAGGKTLPPEATVVNPNISANAHATEHSPSLEETKHLAAVGVSYMMAMAVMQRMNTTRSEEEKLDPKPLLGLVAIGTVSDVVKMGWLNRLLVREGLQQMRAGEDKNILRFMRGVRIPDPTVIDESTIAFKLGPIINAPGRLGDSVAWAFLSAIHGDVPATALEGGVQQTAEELKEALETVKSPAQKEKEARSAEWRERNPDKLRKPEENKPHPLYNTIPENPYLDRLITQSDACNELRKDIEFAMRDEIRRESAKQTNSPVQLIAGEGWHEGVIGIAASRVKEEFGLPAVVGSITQLSDGRWQAKFSARSIRVPNCPVDIGTAFGALGPQHEHDTTALLAKAGGHPMAAGATMLAPTREALEEKITRFRTELNERLGEATERALAQRVEAIFGTLDVSAVTIAPNRGEGSLAERLHSLLAAIPQAGPFGEGMRAPQVAIRGVGIYPPQTGKSQSRRGHLNFDVMGGHNGIRIHCRASNAGGTAMGDTIAALQAGAKNAIVIGELKREADGALRMEASHVLPDRGLASDPAFSESGIFSLAGLGQGRNARTIA
jgi:single-stranded DNA-specific DHH superfamily exonuclease